MPAFYAGRNSDPTGQGGLGQQRFYDPGELAQAGLMKAQTGAVRDPYNAAMAQVGLGQQAEANKAARFSSIYGLLSGQIGNQSGAFTAGGQNTAPPPITTGPVYNPQQMQAQINQSAANVNQGMQSQNARTTAGLAGRGFGANSPLAAALTGANEAQARATNAATGTSMRGQMATANARNLLDSQNALSSQWATQNQLDIERKKPYIQAQSQLLQALASMV